MATIDDNKKNEKVTEELKKFNELFAKRYTNENEEYIAMTQRSNSPPVVDDWDQTRNIRRQQQFDSKNQRCHSSNDRRQYENSSNNHRPYRNRSRSPHYRDTRR